MAITTEYEDYLYNLTETNKNIPALMSVPTGETIYTIDLNTRKISAPNFIGVESDHRSNYVFFEIDRFYDMIDLSSTIGLIVIQNAKGEKYVQIIPYYDVYTHYNKIIFPWIIQTPVTSYSGVVTFSFKFFKINPITKQLIYELNTMPAKTKVLVGDWAGEFETINPESLLVNNDLINLINGVIRAKEYLSIYWQDAEQMIESNQDTLEPILDPALPEEEE